MTHSRIYWTSVLSLLWAATVFAQTGSNPPAEGDSPTTNLRSVPGGENEAARTAAPRKMGQSPAASKERYVRLTRDPSGNVTALETAVVRLTPKDPAKKGPTVDLVAAVHIADQAYYERLNKRFKQYDAVLYELVAPEGTRIPKGGRKSGDSPVSAIQKAMKDVLQLEFQLDAIDYTPKTFVHADLSPERLVEAMNRRGESIWTMLARMMGYALARQNQSNSASDFDILLALFDRNRALALKRICAEQLQDMEGSLVALEGPDGSALVHDRNQAALEGLRKQVAAGKHKLAIFYGAAHMPDFETQLREQFGLVPTDTQWSVAWNLVSPNEGATKNRPARQ